MSTLSIIVAIDEHNAIGKENKLLCHLPNDLKYFKSITEGHTIIMGRKTYESLPNGGLPNRRNIIITRNASFQATNCDVAHSLTEAISLCKDEGESFIIGGGILYKEAIKLVDKLYITQIHHKFEDADTFFPIIDYNQWIKISSIDNQKNEKNKYSHSFIIYKRK